LEEAGFPCPPNNLPEAQMDLLCGLTMFTLQGYWETCTFADAQMALI
jgi:hypothetical protein